jgi:DNA ligase-1
MLFRTTRIFAAFAALLLFFQPSFAEEKTPSTASVEKPQLMLANICDPTMDPTGWWVSEKLDGVRGYWTGSQMVSRFGNIISVPAWFTSNFPDFPLDGELWIERGRFSEISGLIRRTDAGDQWQKVWYCIFDAPSDGLGFEKRMGKARQWFDAHGSSRVRVLAQERCQGKAHLETMLAKTESQGGEGLMLRRPGSLYTAGRSADLLKVKSFLDTEAKVVEHIGGSGKYTGKMGSIRVELPNGIRFAIGTGFTDKDRENPPPIGSTVTFKYKELNPSGVPRFAVFLRVRDDM